MLTYGLLFGVVPLVDVAFDNPRTAWTSWWPAGWVAWSGLVTLYGGYRLAMRVWPATPSTRKERRWSEPLAVGIAALLLLVAVGSVVVEIQRSVGLSYYIHHFASRHTLIRDPVSLLIRISLAAPSVMLIIGNWLRRPTKGRLLLVLAWLPPALLVSAFLGQRWRAVAILVAALGAYHLGRRRIPLLLAGGLGAVLVIAFLYVGSTRNVVGTERATQTLAGSAFYYNYVARHEIGSFRELSTIIAGTPDPLPYQAGRTLLSVLPGTPWPTGGAVYSRYLFPELYGGGTSIPPSLPGELWMNFGAWGPYAGLLLFGGLVGSLEGLRRRHPGSTVIMLVTVYTAVPLAGILRGDFTTFAGFGALSTLPLLLSLPLVERGRPTGDPARG
jgi:oligosaccharide repeat unit polymerase